jgi:hypothetical protein
MAYYLVRATPVPERLNELAAKLAERAFVELEPFGRALTTSLQRARRFPDGTAIWEEEDYCRPPLAQERESVLDHYFTDLSVQQIERGSGWELIAELPPLFPALSNAEPGRPGNRRNSREGA